MIKKVKEFAVSAPLVFIPMKLVRRFAFLARSVNFPPFLDLSNAQNVYLVLILLLLGFQFARNVLQDFLVLPTARQFVPNVRLEIFNLPLDDRAVIYASLDFLLNRVADRFVRSAPKVILVIPLE